MSDTFAFLRLTAREGDWQHLHASIRNHLAPQEIWGTFQGLFGVGSNELIAVTVGDDNTVTASIETARGLDVEHVDALMLKPTARPTATAPLTREGLYVFRFLHVANADIEEIASLSAEAWRTFESPSEYQAQAQALFRQRDRSEVRGRMLLLTWYDGLTFMELRLRQRGNCRKFLTRQQSGKHPRLRAPGRHRGSRPPRPSLYSEGGED